MTNWYPMNPKVFLYNTALSAQLTCLTGLSLYSSFVSLHFKRLNFVRIPYYSISRYFNLNPLRPSFKYHS